MITGDSYLDIRYMNFPFGLSVHSYGCLVIRNCIIYGGVEIIIDDERDLTFLDNIINEGYLKINGRLIMGSIKSDIEEWVEHIS